ncbi:hypothetical protein [Streptomyces sp. NBC_01233]|uniref:hypothetical protein n=1 Tax=Streptomyces sp. NBC_01233 TaxID=2903787 RepID=UPI002E155530|nr:hypothetical protein OG332_10655 [Streptomyces sp. NBC_01233]
MTAFQFGPNADFILQPGRYAWAVDVADTPELPTRGRQCNGSLTTDRALTAEEVTTEALAWIRDATGWPTAAVVRGSIWTI